MILGSFLVGTIESPAAPSWAAMKSLQRDRWPRRPCRLATGYYPSSLRDQELRNARLVDHRWVKFHAGARDAFAL